MCIRDRLEGDSGKAERVDTQGPPAPCPEWRGESGACQSGSSDAPPGRTCSPRSRCTPCYGGSDRR
eukprot:2200933-Pyramimonas_sp.AAC.1